jgi:hypothetical protein
MRVTPFCGFRGLRELGIFAGLQHSIAVARDDNQELSCNLHRLPFHCWYDHIDVVFRYDSIVDSN